MNIKPLTYKNMHGEMTLHPCYTIESSKVVPMTTSGGYQLYAMPGGAKHTERKQSTEIAVDIAFKHVDELIKRAADDHRN